MGPTILDFQGVLQRSWLPHSARSWGEVQTPRPGPILLSQALDAPRARGLLGKVLVFVSVT